MTDPTCPSCNVPYRDHLGLIGTCAALQEAKKELTRLREIVYLEPYDTLFQCCADERTRFDKFVREAAEAARKETP